MIALDLDGTLLSSTGLISPRNQAALHAARAAGIEIVIATGRRHFYAMRQLRALDLPADSILISSNGAVVRTVAADLIERSLMTESSCRRLFAELGTFRDALVVTFDRVGPDGDDERGALVVEELAGLHASIEKWMIANDPYIDRIHPIEDSLAAGNPIQMMLCGTISRMRAAEALLRAIPGVSHVDDTEEAAPGASTVPPAIALHRTEYPSRDLSIVDILPAGASKGAALTRLAASRGLSISNVMAIGDNWNDLPMLGVAGTPVLMGNAPADLLLRARAHGWWITRTNEADGVAHAIEAALTRAGRLHPTSIEAPAPELATASAG